MVILHNLKPFGSSSVLCAHSIAEKKKQTYLNQHHFVLIHEHAVDVVTIVQVQPLEMYFRLIFGIY